MNGHRECDPKGRFHVFPPNQIKCLCKSMEHRPEDTLR